MNFHKKTFLFLCLFFICRTRFEPTAAEATLLTKKQPKPRMGTSDRMRPNANYSMNGLNT